MRFPRSRAGILALTGHQGTGRTFRQTPECCIIFDLDGTLVDSETLCNQAFLDLLPDLHSTCEQLVQRYRGQKLAAIFSDIETRMGRRLPEDFEKTYRRQVAVLFERDLKPVPGAKEMLDRLDLPKCIASSGPPAKIRHALEVSGLAPYFDTRVFSSYDVGSWKPDPGLFLHAARGMGAEAGRCVVVEDSEVGITAAHAAGMKALHYRPDGSEVASRGAIAFQNMSQLPDLLRSVLT